ncbi:coenzyme F420 hydrogenase/dehydrogenase beta subunit domain protein [Bacteroides coprosuis DSM 18011]|uniref:Coenzyme F420 hydrogenase/dehydrogenase beta subunit domain protein n=1 Tax=Bacteroides coprosuis DSM 18011 TaxID=679937 RepID=F3ZS37_9BACE|nr:Coenzyme F420 hydrogenase/dehydrogenase, beta subunit C-terminal domain [Bacteroides coprosuis]EGJ72058.1 coenzyme F420 hydrogenase/dehydrogenase beta subunit domain protein [Bacteroides coprosuis DSM 18011]
MRGLGNMWGTGLFKNNACDFCDDVTTELADISLGDAWLSPYFKDGRGTNVVVVRSNLAKNIIDTGVNSSVLEVLELNFDQFLKSQQGSFNHRHKALAYRVKLAKKKGVIVPPKRHDKENISFDFKLVQKQRLITRKKSLDTWSVGGEQLYQREMPKALINLKNKTKLNHYIRAVKRRLSL